MTPDRILDEGRDADIRRALKVLADFELRPSTRGWSIRTKSGVPCGTIRRSGALLYRTLGVVIDGMRKRVLRNVPTGRPPRVGQPHWSPASPDWYAHRGSRKKSAAPTPTDVQGTE